MFQVPFPPNKVGAFPKKFKKLKNVILALFLAKPDRDRPRKRKKKIVPCFIPTLSR